MVHCLHQCACLRVKLMDIIVRFKEHHFYIFEIHCVLSSANRAFSHNFLWDVVYVMKSWMTGEELLVFHDRLARGQAADHRYSKSNHLIKYILMWLSCTRVSCSIIFRQSKCGSFNFLLYFLDIQMMLIFWAKT
jgi:hypothetical protein